jgi:NAD(P)-dependent dehydrogenase (short-subunit alcohol dehydrogenase family)
MMSGDSQTTDLSARVALVTGGSRGIGLAIAGALLDAGARVSITGRTPSNLEDARKQLARGDATRGDRVHAAVADVRDADDAAHAVEGTVQQFGGLDILVNNAGVGMFRTVADTDVASWHDVIETNLSGIFFCCHAAIPHLKKRGGGWIINISSLAGKNPFPSGAAYCASKAAVNAFSESLMQEVRHDNIRVSYIMPGSVSTGFSRGESPSGPADDWKLAPEDVAEVVIDLIRHPARSLPSRVELRPSRPPKR